MVPWSELPVELLEAVEDNVILYVDKVRLCSVCAPWRSALTKLPQPRLHQTPCLLLQYDDNNVATWKLFKGSSHGWVVTLGDSPSLCLINPLTRAQLKLPPRSSFPDVVKYRSDKINNEYALRDAYDRNAFYTLDGRHISAPCQTTRKHKTNSFRIFKLDDVAHGFPSLIEVKDLGGDALFLGLNLSSSISCGDFPDCRGNCIYFTDDSDDIIGQEGIQGVDFDMGIYDLNDGNIETLSVPGYKCEGKNFWPPPIWVMPKTY
ncbi:hypothetical protein C3L33_17858, partial [Rhododendron williamsianum]